MPWSVWWGVIILPQFQDKNQQSISNLYSEKNFSFFYRIIMQIKLFYPIRHPMVILEMNLEIIFETSFFKVSLIPSRETMCPQFFFILKSWGTMISYIFVSGWDQSKKDIPRLSNLYLAKLFLQSE